MRFFATTLVALTLLGTTAHADTPVIGSQAAWARMQTLAGNWKGTYTEDGKTKPSRTKFKMVSGDSVLMNTLGEDTPYEMITMFHMDLKDLLATHYCAAKNQPRFKAVAGGEANQIVFDFKDGTNIGPHDGHMQRVIFTFVDKNHHVEDWVFLADGKESTAHFDFHRAR